MKNRIHRFYQKIWKPSSKSEVYLARRYGRFDSFSNMVVGCFKVSLSVHERSINLVEERLLFKHLQVQIVEHATQLNYIALNFRQISTTVFDIA